MCVCVDQHATLTARARVHTAMERSAVTSAVLIRSPSLDSRMETALVYIALSAITSIDINHSSLNVNVAIEDRFLTF